jgi:hypothetical protein
MTKRSQAIALALFAVLGASAFGSGMATPSHGGPDSKPAVALSGIVSDEGPGWFLLDTGLGYEGMPTLYWVDGGVLCAFNITP